MYKIIVKHFKVIIYLICVFLFIPVYYRSFFIAKYSYNTNIYRTTAHNNQPALIKNVLSPHFNKPNHVDVVMYYRFGGRYTHIEYVKTSLRQAACVSGAVYFFSDMCFNISNVVCIHINNSIDTSSVFYIDEDHTNNWYIDMAYARFKTLWNARNIFNGAILYIETDNMLFISPKIIQSLLDDTNDIYIPRLGNKFSTPAILYFKNSYAIDILMKYITKWVHYDDNQRKEIIGSNGDGLLHGNLDQIWHF